MIPPGLIGSQQIIKPVIHIIIVKVFLPAFAGQGVPTGVAFTQPVIGFVIIGGRYGNHGLLESVTHPAAREAEGLDFVDLTAGVLE